MSIVGTLSVAYAVVVMCFIRSLVADFVFYYLFCALHYVVGLDLQYVFLVFVNHEREVFPRQEKLFFIIIVQLLM